MTSPRTPWERPRYSGTLSRQFWAAVEKLKGKDRAHVYMMGCILQEVEGRVLHSLRKASKK